MDVKNLKKVLLFFEDRVMFQKIEKGDTFNENNRIVRPGSGLPPKYFKVFKGKKVNKDVEMGTKLSWDLIS